MKLTKTSAYAALATAFLASHPGKSVVQARQVAEHLSIPIDSALKILQTLARHQLIESQLGRSGGYRLAKDAKQITLLHIVEAIDGPIVAEMPLTSTPDVLSDRLDLMQAVWAQAAQRIRDELSRATVVDLARCHQASFLMQAH